MEGDGFSDKDGGNCNEDKDEGLADWCNNYKHGKTQKAQIKEELFPTIWYPS